MLQRFYRPAPSFTLLKAFETKIVNDFPEFLHQDLSVIITSFEKLGLMPKQIIQ
jgi:hypothetical protein